MSDFNNSKRVKLSSVENGIKSEDEDEAFPVEEKQPIAGCSDSPKRKTPEDASVTATGTDTSDANGNDLVEDVLVLIFENDFLDTTDLLNFRLVSRRWRDAATTVLLQRGACQISLNIRSVPIPSNGNFNSTKGVYCNNNNHDALLDDLNEIISQSPKFPCSSFRFVNSYSFGDAHYKNKIDTSSLLNFFSIYGNNVKTIAVGDCILKSDVRNLLLDYTPNLECLDLQYMRTFGLPAEWPSGPNPFTEPLFPESEIHPNLKTLVLGPHTRSYSFELELVHAAINLQSVETTRVEGLKLLLDHGKGGLIKKLRFCLFAHDLKELSVFERLAESQLKLTTLIVSARDPFVQGLPGPGSFLKMETCLNRILESSKDTLKCFEFRICPFADIKFPIFKNLECLKLVQSMDPQEGRLSTLLRSNPQLLLQHRELNEVDGYICPNRPSDSFPNLKKIQLDIENYGIELDGSLLLLETCQPHNKEIVPHFYKTVQVLEIFSTLPNTIERAKSVSNLFQNVTTLKIKCESVQELNCSLWVISPLAKSIEMYGMSKHYSSCNELVGNRRVNDDVSTERIDEVDLVDSFFTGFPIELCQKLKNAKEIPMEIEGNPSLQDFLRVKPSICNLKDLVDFKMLFTKLGAPFVSHVTGFLAFRNMPKTNFTFAHASPIKCDEMECEMKQVLAPMSTFVHFTHMNVPKCFDNNSDNYVDNYNSDQYRMPNHIVTVQRR